MSQLIQFCTRASLYNREFGGSAGWPAAGMGYIFVTGLNRLWVVDGGHGEDAESLTALLTHLAGGHPTVDLWIVTHPHLDHYGALREIAARQELRERVTVKTIGWYFPEAFRDRNGGSPCENANRRMTEICGGLGAAAYTPEAGDTVTLDDLALTFLFTPVDCEELHNPNSLSLIFRVQSPEKTAILTGDACPVTLQTCAERFGEALRAQILQLPHHGLCDTSNADFYRLVRAETLLIPISEAGDRAMRSGIYGEATAANRIAEELAQTVIRAYGGTTAVSL